MFEVHFPSQKDIVGRSKSRAQMPLYRKRIENNCGVAWPELGEYVGLC